MTIASVRLLPQYIAEVKWWRTARLASARLRVDVAGTWYGNVSLESSSGRYVRRLAGISNGARRSVGNSVLVATGLDAVHAIDVGPALAAARAAGIETTADRIHKGLSRDCRVDIVRVTAEIDAKVLDPAVQEGALQALAGRQAVRRSRAAQRTIARMPEWLDQLADAGVDEEQLVQTFRLVLVGGVQTS